LVEESKFLVVRQGAVLELERQQELALGLEQQQELALGWEQQQELALVPTLA